MLCSSTSGSSLQLLEDEDTPVRTSLAGSLSRACKPPKGKGGPHSTVQAHPAQERAAEGEAQLEVRGGVCGRAWSRSVCLSWGSNASPHSRAPARAHARPRILHPPQGKAVQGYHSERPLQ